MANEKKETPTCQMRSRGAVMVKFTEDGARAVCAVLAAVEHIHVDAHVSTDGAVEVWSMMGTLPLPEEITVLRAFSAATDARLNYRSEVPA